MCGRYAFFEQWKDFLAEFDINSTLEEWPPIYNAAPSMDLPVVYQLNGSRFVDTFRWGLIPHWSKDPKIGYKMINARAESVAEKPAFRKSFTSKRCLIPASGFFEWKKEGKVKQPYFIRFKSAKPMWFAGLYDEWTSTEDAEVVESFTIITTQANETLTPLHDRMPALLTEESFDFWLNPENRDIENLTSLLQPWPDHDISFYKVSESVNTPKNQGPDLVEPLPDLFG